MSSISRKIARAPKAPPKVERLAGAAIIRDGVTESRDFKSHWQIRAALGDDDPATKRVGDIEGFVTDAGRFVSRREAVEVGVKSGQLSERWSRTGRELLSSDIDW